MFLLEDLCAQRTTLILSLSLSWLCLLFFTYYSLLLLLSCVFSWIIWLSEPLRPLDSHSWKHVTDQQSWDLRRIPCGFRCFGKKTQNKLKGSTCLWCLPRFKWFYHEKSIRFHHGSHQQIPRVFPAFSCGFPSIFPRFSHGFPPFDVRFIMFWHRFSRQTCRPHLLPRVVLRSPRCQRRSASRILQGTSMATAEHLGIRRAPGPARKKGELWNLMGILMGNSRKIQRENWCLMMS